MSRPIISLDDYDSPMGRLERAHQGVAVRKRELEAAQARFKECRDLFVQRLCAEFSADDAPDILDKHSWSDALEHAYSERNFQDEAVAECKSQLAKAERESLIAFCDIVCIRNPDGAPAQVAAE